jgi:hypothetical protein
VLAVLSLTSQAKDGFVAPAVEFREAYGMGFQQKRNDVLFGADRLGDVRTKAQLDDGAKRDLIVATIAVKYTQVLQCSMHNLMRAVYCNASSVRSCSAVAGTHQQSLLDSERVLEGSSAAAGSLRRRRLGDTMLKWCLKRVYCDRQVPRMCLRLRWQRSH